MTLKHTRFIAREEDEGKRLLSVLKKKLSEFSKEDLRFAITRHQCKVNGIVERFESRKVKTLDSIEISVEKKPDFTFQKENVLLEDDYFCIYNKPSGIAVSETFFSLFPAHRLDRDTTGAILLVKERKNLGQFENLFRERTIDKSYLAIVSPCPSQEKGTIENHLVKKGHKEGIIKWAVGSNGIYAKTSWVLEKKNKDLALLRCFPFTGRTHQIRVHLSYIGNPIIGDVQYGPRNTSIAKRPLLHSESLAFVHPFTQKKVFIKAPLPQDFIEVIKDHKLD